jgi:hypothetical protein
MTGTSDQVRCRLIARRVISEYARDRVAQALYEAIVEGLEFGPCDLPLQEDRDWIRGAISVALQDATDTALDGLSWSVSRALEQAPGGLLDRFEGSHHLEHLGLD